MQLIYGPLTAVRVLEENVCWKQQEKQNTEIIRAIVPQLEDDYVHLLSQWEQVLAQTEDIANSQLCTAVQQPNDMQADHLQQIHELLRASVYQSEQLLQQLEIIRDNSQAIQRTPLVAIIFDHIASRSRYFLDAVSPVVNNPLTIPGSNISTDANNFKHPAQDHTLGLPNNATDRAQDPQHFQDICANIGNTHQFLQPKGIVNAKDEQSVPIGGHRLPPLPYPYDALEPYIDEKTMRIHHNKHHKSYVDGLNRAELALEEARKTGKFEFIKYWENELAFNGAGHYLHTIFWQVMSPKGGGMPTGELLQQIKHDFGSFEAFKQQFTNAAEKVEGGGWTILVWSPRSRRLEILQAEKHQNLSQWDVVPLLSLDVWEHAYYLKYQNDRAKYIAAWWNIVNWPAVASRYEKARLLKWTPF